MNRNSIRSLMLPPGPILSLMLIGLMILSAILYYRSVKIQRFLEPALAISQPKIRFTQNITTVLTKEFGSKEIKGVRLRSGSILVDHALLGDHGESEADPTTFDKLAKVLLSALENTEVREHVSIILVGIRFPLTEFPEDNKTLLLKHQQRAWMLVNALYSAEPKLEQKYATYFVPAAIPLNATTKENDWIEFRLVPTEQLHIEVLQKFEKYMQ